MTLLRSKFLGLALGAALMVAPVASMAAGNPVASMPSAVATQAGDAAGMPSANPEMNAAGSTAHDVEESHDATNEEQGHGESSGLPQLNVHTYPSQIFWLLIMFLVLYTTFSKAILPMIGGVIETRENLIKGNLDSAQALKDKAQEIQIAYEKNLEKAKLDASRAVQDVEAAAKKKAADQIEQFRKRAESDVGAAETRVNAAKDKAMSDMTVVAAEVASLAAEKITGISTDKQKAQAIVEHIASKAKAA